jgi:5'-nucleotidase
MLNSGSFRSDQVHPAGDFTLGDLVKLFPFKTAPIKMRVTGALLLQALEVSVSKYPALDGRFCQVAGIRFSFDPSREAGHRVLAGSVVVKGAPLDLAKPYVVIVSNFMRKGKEGYGMFVPSASNPDCKDLQDIEATLSISNVLQNHFRVLSVLNGIECTSKVFLSHFSHTQYLPSSHRRFIRVYVRGNAFVM